MFDRSITALMLYSHCTHAVLILHSFDRFILLCIMSNAVCMGMADYSNFDKETETLLMVGWRNPLLYYTDLAFTVIFTCECLVKVIAMGLGPFGRNTYLADHWNQLDFVVVVTGILEVIPGMPSLGEYSLLIVQSIHSWMSSLGEEMIHTMH
jgi:hypothetical protein